MNLDRFQTTFGSRMALIGVAVGLANVWRFPYMAGNYGGGAFVLAYLVFVIALGAPALIAEWSLGRLTRSGPAAAFRRVRMPGGRAVGAILFVTVFMATSYYTVVVAQVLYYTLRGGIVPNPQAFHAEHFSGITLLNVGATVFVFLAMGLVVGRGVAKGIERLSRIAMPLVGVMLLLVVIRSVTLPGAGEGIRYLLYPDFSRVTSDTFLAALGQAFFSLSLGGTFFLVYGSYLPRRVSLRTFAATTITGDTMAAILGGLAILPAAFALGAEPDSGPALLFFTLPELFGRMPLGQFVAPLFFGALFLAAFLSAVAALEVIVNVGMEWTGQSRLAVVVAAVAVQIPLALPSMASASYLEWSDLIWGSTMQPIGSALTLLAFGFFVSRKRALAEANRGDPQALLGNRWRFWIRYVVPLSVFLVLLWGWADRIQALLP